MDESGTDGAEYSRKFAFTIRSLVNARDLQFECAGVLHETLLVPVLMYGSGTMLWKVNERSKVGAVQMDNFRGLQGIRRMDRVPKTRIGGLCGVTKGVDERIDEGVLRWFGHVERMEINRIARKVYVRECAGSPSMGRPQKRWIDTVMCGCQTNKENGAG